MAAAALARSPSRLSRSLWAVVSTVPLLCLVHEKIVGVDAITSEDNTYGIPDALPHQGEVVLTLRPAVKRPGNGSLVVFSDTTTGELGCGYIIGMGLEWIILENLDSMSRLHMVPQHHVCIEVPSADLNGPVATHILHTGLLRGVAAALIWPPGRASVTPSYPPPAPLQ